MKNGWRRTGELLARRTGWVLGAALALSIVLVVGLMQLEFATGQDSYIDPDSEVARDNQRYQSLFGGEQMIVLLTAAPGRTAVDMLAPDNLAAFDETAAAASS